ncbi:MAG TPA: HAD-IIIA family hydrolase [Candidatus Binataceae bacterium]|nr:HAD-IIIA family hydrolase [Candidatus Binataceae bacterium]
MAMSLGNAALFLDLAGTLVKIDETRSIPRDARGNLIIELLPGVADKLRPIHDHLIFVVTNQAGVRRGWFTQGQAEAALENLDHQLGDILTAWKICPHIDEDNCTCRKPKGGMITELAERYGVDLEASTMVGDQEVDELAGRAAGVGRFVPAKDFFGWD